MPIGDDESLKPHKKKYVTGFLSIFLGHTKFLSYENDQNFHSKKEISSGCILVYDAYPESELVLEETRD